MHTNLFYNISLKTDVLQLKIPKFCHLLTMKKIYINCWWYWVNVNKFYFINEVLYLKKLSRNLDCQNFWQMVWEKNLTFYLPLNLAETVSTYFSCYLFVTHSVYVRGEAKGAQGVNAPAHTFALGYFGRQSKRGSLTSLSAAPAKIALHNTSSPSGIRISRKRLPCGHYSRTLSVSRRSTYLKKCKFPILLCVGRAACGTFKSCL